MTQLSRKQIQSISPYDENFFKYIDRKIRVLVQTLVNQGYLIMYSCEGHDLRMPRYITLAFTSKSTRNSFIKLLAKGITNSSLIIDKLDSLTTEVIDDEIIQHGSQENEIKGCNYLFRKNEKFYCFVRVPIGLKVDFDLKMNISLAGQLKVAFWNLLFRKKLTKKMIKNISQGKNQIDK